MSFLPIGAKLLLSVPEMLMFLNRMAGYPILATLLQAAMTQRRDPAAPVGEP